MQLYLRNGSAQTILRAATLRYKLQIKLSISPSRSILTKGQLVSALTLYRQAPGRVATGVLVSKVTDMTRPRKNPRRKRDSNPRSSALEADALTTRPTRRLKKKKEEEEEEEEVILILTVSFLIDYKRFQTTQACTLHTENVRVYDTTGPSTRRKSRSTRSFRADLFTIAYKFEYTCR